MPEVGFARVRYRNKFCCRGRKDRGLFMTLNGYMSESGRSHHLLQCSITAKCPADAGRTCWVDHLACLGIQTEHDCPVVRLPANACESPFLSCAISLQ